MDYPPEQEVSPGVFVTDFRTAASIAATQPSTRAEHKQPQSTSPPPPTDYSELSDVNQLSFELQQLHNSVDHLIASNEQLVAAMAEDAADGRAEDEEYATAIRENMLVIDRKQSEAIELQSLIDSMLSGHALDKPAGARGVVSGVTVSAAAATTSSASLSSAGSPSNDQDEGDGGDGIYL